MCMSACLYARMSVCTYARMYVRYGQRGVGEPAKAAKATRHQCTYGCLFLTLSSPRALSRQSGSLSGCLSTARTAQSAGRKRSTVTTMRCHMGPRRKSWLAGRQVIVRTTMDTRPSRRMPDATTWKRSPRSGCRGGPHQSWMGIGTPGGGVGGGCGRIAILSVGAARHARMWGTLAWSLIASDGKAVF